MHLVGTVTEKVVGFLAPAVDSLAQSGVEQVVVLVDDLRYRHLLPAFHDSVQLVLTPAARNPLRRWQWALEAFREVLRSGQVKVVQLHGLLPCVMGAWVAHNDQVAASMHYSPGGSRSIGPSLSMSELLRWVISPTQGRRDRRVATSAIGLAQERRRPGRSTNWSMPIETPIDATFFDVQRTEARHPLVVSGHRMNHPRSTELLAQLAVLLSGEDLRLAFNWIGSVDQNSRQRLKAANVGVFDCKTTSERASKLAAGWIYLAPGGVDGFPTLLVEAMAVGLPCVAWDSAHHRDVIQHGQTGYLCRSEDEIVQCIADLIDSAALRAQIGAAARERAIARFSVERFRDSLFAAYDLQLHSRAN